MACLFFVGVLFLEVVAFDFFQVLVFFDQRFLVDFENFGQEREIFGSKPFFLAKLVFGFLLNEFFVIIENLLLCNLLFLIVLRQGLNGIVFNHRATSRS
jgi:hypothetical protein